MKFHFEQLKKYVDHEESVETLASLLNSLGLEVEEMITLPQDLAGLVVGEVVEKVPHPNADRLTLCQVEVGKPAPQQVVCGASNHSVGSKVVVALPGQTLPGDFAIVEREIRGVLSAGMMCSMRELGLGEDHEGIILLPEDAVVGTSPKPYLTQIDLSVTPNRPDCLGWIGIAREVALATGKDLRIPEVAVVQTQDKESLPIRLDDPAGCARYLGRIVRGVKIGPSPQWLQDALRAVGLNPINNVVDITNFVLMETGQPLHAFDLAKLAGPAIHARTAKVGEKFQALNGEEYELQEHQLVIADSEKAVALAGVMGGANSEVSDTTTDLLIECAYFNPSRIRLSAKASGLSSDSSFRFERGVDPYRLDWVIDRCVSLILEIAGGKATSDILEARSEEHLPQPLKVRLRTHRASERIGTPVATSHQRDILNRLGCDAVEVEEDILEVAVPTFRPDLTREIDLIEELARHFGYSNIPSVPPELPTDQGKTLPVLAIDRRAREFLVDRGWIETKSFSFSPANFADDLRLGHEHSLRHSVRVQNPIAADMAQLRTTLVISLLENLQRNAHRGERNLRIFESGKVYLPDCGNLLNCEREALGMALLGSASEHWSSPERAYDFFDAKGTVEALFQEMGISDYRLESYACEYLHPGQSGEWKCGDQALGIVGRLHPSISKNFDLLSEPILVELDLVAIAALAAGGGHPIQVPSPYPPIRRDLSLTVPVTTTVEELLTLFESSQTPFLESIEIFDRYTGSQVGEGNQSLGFRLTYRSAEKTLTEDEIVPIHRNLLEKLNQDLGATQRGMSLEVGTNG
jgi:phenylalanyl-tRNA synthetase beta chain